MLAPNFLLFMTYENCALFVFSSSIHALRFVLDVSLCSSGAILTCTDLINGLSCPQSSGWVGSMWGTGRQLGEERAKVFLPSVTSLSGCCGGCMSGTGVRQALQFLTNAPTPLPPQVSVYVGWVIAPHTGTAPSFLVSFHPAHKVSFMKFSSNYPT